MEERPNLIERLREGLAEGERFDRQMEAAGSTLTRNIHLRALLELFASGMPEGSQFIVRGGRLFGGGDLLHEQHPDLPIKVMAYGDIWLPPSQEITDDLWAEVAQLALVQPERFREAVQSIQEADLAFDTCPP